MDNIKFLNFNAYRAVEVQKIKRFLDVIKTFKSSIITIQEINVISALKVFQNDFRVIINVEQNSRDFIGICTLVKKDLKVKDILIGGNGRIIGVLFDSLKVFNLYPKSGTQNRNLREIFFRQELPHLLKFWDNFKGDLMFCGDFNCIHRKQDSVHNPDAHLQPGLTKFIKTYGLSDDFISVHGELTDVFSRVTPRSKTRIDFILSDTNKCLSFEYVSYPFLDHKLISAEYSIQLSSRSNYIPKDRFFPGWVIGRELEHDEVFVDVMYQVLEQLDYEVGLSPDAFSPAFIWFKFKETLTLWAKRRFRFLKKVKNHEYQMMLQYYNMAMEDLSRGMNCQEEIKTIINDLNQFYNRDVQKKIDEAQFIEIKDNTYDIIKKQKEKKFQNGGFIDKIRVDGVVYEGNVEIVDAVESKMKKELTSFESGDDSLSGMVEKKFLDLLPKLKLEPAEVAQLEGDINEAEVADILDSKKIDLDSSPGYDGLTYRFIKLFWKHHIFRKIFLSFLNEIKLSGEFGPIDNWGVMVLKNKRGGSIEYSRKRKLTKINKDINLLGKIWSNRCKLVIMDKVVPKSQFICRTDQNIVDEMRQIRDVNLFLLGKDRNGSILSLDYADAFRSVSLSWFSKVMTSLGFPRQFMEWFWNMVRNIGIVICVNRCRSSVILNKRGFMEGFPPSMACWVLSSMALITALERNLLGIKLPDGRLLKNCNLADDQKIFLREPQEVHMVDKLVAEFEGVSGVKLHRSKLLNKCNILSFGSHQDYRDWPDWVNKVDKLKVIGGTFINSGSLEKANSENVKNKIIGKLNENWGMKGTLFQKVFFCNTFCFSKLNYLGQVFLLEKKDLDLIKSKALAFLYAGYNERPIQVVNFRKRINGGLSLHHPQLRAEALMLKNMHRECNERDIQVSGGVLSGSVYGLKTLFVEICKAEVGTSSKEIYKFLLRKMVRDKTSLVPSRIERKIQTVKWSRAFKNIEKLKVSQKEKEFAFMLVQDILPVNGRLHRKNSDHRCGRKMADGKICADIQDRMHFFVSCTVIQDIFVFLKSIISIFLGRLFNDLELLHISFTVVNRKTTALMVWIVVKCFYKMFHEKLMDYRSVFREIVRDLDFYQEFALFKADEVKQVRSLIMNNI